MKIYEYIAQKVMIAISDRVNHEIRLKNKIEIETWIRNQAPSGSGIDNGTKINWSKSRFSSRDERIVLDCSFHHMDEHGYYDGWTYHEIWIRPSLISGICIDVKGINKNEIKDFLGDLFYHWLNEYKVMHSSEAPLANS